MRAMRLMALIITIVALAPSRALAQPEAETKTRRVHDHSTWSVVLSPFVGRTNVHSKSVTDYGMSAGLQGTLSRALALTAAGTIGFGGGDEHRTYLLSVGPRYMFPLNQRDRFYCGLAIAVLSAARRGHGSRTGYGPEIVIGVDYSISEQTCTIVEFAAGHASIDNHDGGDVMNPTGAGWARVRLGIRLGT